MLPAQVERIRAIAQELPKRPEKMSIILNSILKYMLQPL
jgi:hypothetical protein